MITRRNFTKVASITAGSLFVSSGEESQEKEAPVAGNPATVTSGFVQNAGAEIYYETAPVLMGTVDERPNRPATQCR